MQTATHGAALARFGHALSDPTRTDEPHRFRVDVAEVVLTRVGTPADHLVLQWWRPGEGLRTQRRA